VNSRCWHPRDLRAALATTVTVHLTPGVGASREVVLAILRQAGDPASGKACARDGADRPFVPGAPQRKRRASWPADAAEIEAYQGNPSLPHHPSFP